MKKPAINAIVIAKRHLVKVLSVSALIVGLFGAFISIGDDFAFLRMRRDDDEPWLSIRAGLKDLETYDDRHKGKVISRLRKGERGYSELLELIQRNTDITQYGTPVALTAQKRGSKETIARRFERQPVYFGVINEAGLFKLVEDKVLLESWIREYRHQYYVVKGMRWILACFFIQLIATLLPANKELKATDKSAP